MSVAAENRTRAARGDRRFRRKRPPLGVAAAASTCFCRCEVFFCAEVPVAERRRTLSLRACICVASSTFLANTKKPRCAGLRRLVNAPRIPARAYAFTTPVARSFSARTIDASACTERLAKRRQVRYRSIDRYFATGCGSLDHRALRFHARFVTAEWPHAMRTAGPGEAVRVGSGPLPSRDLRYARYATLAPARSPMDSPSTSLPLWCTPGSR